MIGVKRGRATNLPPLMGDFTEDYYKGNAGTALLVAGNNATANRVPALYAIGFNASLKLNPSASFGPRRWRETSQTSTRLR